MDEIRIPVAGDPFYAASLLGSRRTDQDHQQGDCFACYEGGVYLGEMVQDPETGEEVEVFEPVRCHRCRDNRGYLRS